MMDTLVARFSAQLREAVDIARNAQVNYDSADIHNILVSGLGGSGIGGDFVAALIRDRLSLPYIVSKRYDVPAYVDEHTLAIVSSYSGNTEETVTAYHQLMKQGAQMIVVSSGGKLKALATENNQSFIQLPDDWPSPRACLGYSYVQQLGVLEQMGWTDGSLLDAVLQSADLIDKEEEDIKARARQIADLIQGKTCVIYTEDRMEPVAIRFRQQINENAKTLCWHHVIPEMNHNELVGWRDDRSDLAVFFMRNRDDMPRNAVRTDINKEILSNYASVIELWSKGEDMLQRMMYMVHLGDWISVYLAELRGMDAVEVKVIDYLKSELAKV